MNFSLTPLKKKHMMSAIQILAPLRNLILPVIRREERARAEIKRDRDKSLRQMNSYLTCLEEMIKVLTSVSASKQEQIRRRTLALQLKEKAAKPRKRTKSENNRQILIMKKIFSIIQISLS
jgi:hypothetical protein